MCAELDQIFWGGGSHLSSLLCWKVCLRSKDQPPLMSLKTEPPHLLLQGVRWPHTWQSGVAS